VAVTRAEGDAYLQKEEETEEEEKRRRGFALICSFLVIAQ
jgi:hypothetical protein